VTVLVFAYDGSLNGDWVAHYAARFAANTRERRLRLVHVHDGSPPPHLPERIGRIAEECRLLGVALEPELHARGGARVAERLIDLVPVGHETTLICGARARMRNLAFLAGTVSARLLGAGRFQVVALRVVHPGVLGQPGRVLLPLAGHPRGAAHAVPLLRLLGADLRHLHVLFVREASRFRLRDPSHEALEELLAEGRAFVARVEEEVRVALAPHRFAIDASVVLSDDAAREILVQAGKHRARLICLGASDRTLPGRIVRGDLIERILRAAPADVAVYRGVG
jgi:nucleotide-binding universal stress UspA family protein